MAGDTRHTSGYNINSRSEKKVFRLGEDSTLVLATVGFGADAKDIAETMRLAVDVCTPPSAAILSANWC
jgi:20S proteasome subunit beta 6